MAAPFEVGRRYTRRQIYNLLGGDLVSNFPRQAGQVLYCCVALSNNPLAPEVILIRDTPRMLEAARQLACQQEPVPVFLRLSRDRSSALVYQGEFVGEHYSEARAEIRPYIRPGHEPGVRAALFLRQVK